MNCTFSGCSTSAKTNQRLYGGKPYCDDHYCEMLTSDMLHEYGIWPEGADPSKRLRYMVGRTFSELGKNVGESFLSNARIRDRSFAYKKTDSGFEFSITRHLNGHEFRRPMRLIIERWQFNVESLEYQRIGFRDWTSADPE